MGATCASNQVGPSVIGSMGHDEGDNGPPECYVCTETDPPPRLSQCACRGRYVHDECLRKLLIAQREAICMVCLSPHADVIVREPEEVLASLLTRRRRVCIALSSVAAILATVSMAATLGLLSLQNE